jgi:pimeloyl-ACP methyl ester carboxylesterase
MKILKKLKRTLAGVQPAAVAASAGGAALGAMALAQNRLAKVSKPAAGAFVEVDGVRLHYVEKGEGAPLVLIHGNVTQIEDFETSGLIDLAAKTYRVIVFDRPGFGHSARPRGRVWTPAAQADLLCKALQRLGVERCVALGHSWGASVAVALGLNHPEAVDGLVLASGYYYPTDRLDSVLQALPAAPIVGDVLSHTLMPLLARLAWRSQMKTLFAPLPPSAAFSDAIREMALRPSQQRATAVEASLLVPTALSTRKRYGELTMPVSIIVGGDDQLINAQSQSMRLHGDIPQSSLKVMPGIGHMVHHGAPEAVFDEIRDIEQRARDLTGLKASAA